MSGIVLDASAMLKGERGAGKVAGARVSSVNYAEVVSHFVHAGMLSQAGLEPSLALSDT